MTPIYFSKLLFTLLCLIFTAGFLRLRLFFLHRLFSLRLAVIFNEYWREAILKLWVSFFGNDTA